MVAAIQTQDLEAEIRRLTMENALLRQIIRLARLEKYGRGSEKLTDAQLELLEQEPGVQAAEVAREAELPPEKQETRAAQASRRAHPGRAELPAHLPRVIVNLPCAPEQCRCGHCGQPTEVIGYDEREELDVKPAEYFVRVIRREKRACEAHPEAGVAIAAIMSIMETCRRLKLDVRAYLREAMPKLPGWPINHVAELTPTACQTRQPQ